MRKSTLTYDGPRYDKEAWRASVLNGKIGPFKLAQVEAWPVPFDRDLNGPTIMHPEAASAMGVMLRTAWAQGVGIRPSLTYRTFAKQLEKWEDFQSGGNLAARPGTSNHGWGVAADMSWENEAAWQWMKNNAARFGYIFDVPSERWHITYQENQWRRQDMTEEELGQLKASSQWTEGERLYRHKYAGEGQGSRGHHRRTSRHPSARAGARHGSRCDWVRPTSGRNISRERRGEVLELRTALYGSDISTGDIPRLHAATEDQSKRLTRLEWAVIAILVATGAQGLGTVLGGLA